MTKEQLIYNEPDPIEEEENESIDPEHDQLG